MKLLKAEAGVNDGKAGLLSAAGLFAKGGIFDKKSESFNIQELDPYLLFDARSSMLGTLENPTLDLDPATPSTLDVITATRAGVATYTDPDGLIATASADTVRVDYTQGAELTPTKFQHFGQTNFDDSAWQKITTSITADDALAPDGTATADRMVIPLAANSQSSRLTEQSDITSGTTVTISFYVKADGSINPLVLFANGSVFARILFDLPSKTSSFVDGALTITHSIEEAGNGFYRCSATFTSAGIGSISIRNATAGDGVSSLLLWGPQLEEGTTASDFVANTTGSPKFLSSAVYSDRVPMILVEPSATNLFRNSQDLTASPNNMANGTIAQESETFKGQPVFRLTDDTSSGEHRLSIPAGSVSASRVIVHFFVKPDTCSKFCITYPTAGDAAAAWNLQSGSALGSTVGSAVAQTIEDAGDGWFKVSMTYDRPSATATGHNIQTLQDSATSAGNRNYQGDGTLSFLMTMPQLEYGEVQTSIIPTSGSTVTRAADDLVISGSDFSDFFSTTENTFYCEFDPRPSDEGRFLLCAQASSARFIYQGVSDNNWYIYDGTSSSVFGTESSTGLQRAAATFDGTSKEASLNGGGENTSSHNGNLLNVPTELRIGKAYYGGGYLNGHIKRVIWWPYSSDRL